MYKPTGDALRAFAVVRDFQKFLKEKEKEKLSINYSKNSSIIK